MRDWLLRQATDPDASEILRVYQNALVNSLVGLSSPEQIEEALKTWTIDDARRRIETNSVRVCVDCEGRILGYASRQAEKITGLYVQPQAQGQGVGTALMEDLEATARNAGVRNLHVASTIGARGFYLRRGYREVDRMTSSGMETVRMEKALTASGQC